MHTVNTQVRRILTIDDNDAIHSDFRKILMPDAGPSKLASTKAALFGVKTAPATEKVRFELDSAMQGQEGLAKLQTAVGEGRPFSVAFVDMRMPPGWDGLQTIQRLWEADADLQVVICSAYSDYSWEEISARLGLTDRLLILRKPFDPSEVTQIATALSEKWVLRRAAKLKMDELERMVEQRTKELTHLALYDKLTGLANRALFSDRLAKVVQHAKLEQGYKYAVLFLDFDRFKLINDSLGHEAGDALLKNVAGRLTAALQLAGAAVGDAVAARLGGDEFVILIENLANFEDAPSFADGLLRLLSSPYTIADRPVNSTASIGITTSAFNYERAEDVIRDADTAMYRAKAAGKARCVMFEPSMSTEIMQRMEMENELRGAAERGEFVLHYQPIVAVANGMLVGFEALVRWNHPTRGLIAPEDFIPYCEESGLILPAGLWIMARACGQLRAWQQKFPTFSGLTMSVNISAIQIAPALVGEIEEVIRSSGIAPATLVLEITERVLIADLESASRILERVRAMGVRVHVDDFGTGYSSLSSLHQCSLDGIKLDRRFMKNVEQRQDYAAVVKAVVNLAKNLGLTIVAEGVESAEHLALLRSMDCSQAQGFYFGQPCEAAAAEAFIDRQLVCPMAA
jgi:diguanylate cyclase (GGDEF)-like protein